MAYDGAMPVHPSFVVAPDEEDVAAAHEQRRTLAAAMLSLTPREERVVRMRFGEEATYQDVGEVLGVTGARARQIELKALAKLRRTLTRKPLPVVDVTPGRELTFSDKLRAYGKHRQRLADRARMAEATNVQERRVQAPAPPQPQGYRIVPWWELEERIERAREQLAFEEWRVERSRRMSAEALDLRASLLGCPFRSAWGEGVVIKIVEWGVTVRWNNFPAAPLAPEPLQSGAAINVGVFLARSLCAKGFAKPLTEADRIALSEVGR